MSSPSRGDDATGSSVSPSRAPARVDSIDADLDSHLTLSGSDVISRPKNKKSHEDVDSPTPKKKNIEHEARKEDRRDDRNSRPPPQDKRPRSRSRNNRKHVEEQAHVRFPVMQWKGPQKKPRLPELADASDDSSDEDRDGGHRQRDNSNRGGRYQSKRSRSNSRAGASNVVESPLSAGEKIFIEELERAEGEAASMSRKQRKRSQSSNSRDRGAGSSLSAEEQGSQKSQQSRGSTSPFRSYQQQMQQQAHQEHIARDADADATAAAVAADATENNRQRRYRQKMRRAPSKHYVQEPSTSKSLKPLPDAHDQEGSDQGDDDTHSHSDESLHFDDDSHTSDFNADLPHSQSQSQHASFSSLPTADDHTEHHQQDNDYHSEHHPHHPQHRTKTPMYRPKEEQGSQEQQESPVSPRRETPTTILAPIPVQAHPSPAVSPSALEVDPKHHHAAVSDSKPHIDPSKGEETKTKVDSTSLLMQDLLPMPVPSPSINTPSPTATPSLAVSAAEETGKKFSRKSLDDILAEEESASESKEDTGDIERNRSYTEGMRVTMEEDAEHEFKAVQNSNQPLERIVTYCRKYIVSFLNASGGVMYFGVEDDGTVKGVPFSRKGRDLLRLGIDMTVSHIKPQVDPQLVKVVLVPVESEASRKAKAKELKARERSGSRGDSLTRFVVEIHIGRGNAPVYLTQDGNAYFRRSGSVYKMDQELVQRRMERGRPLFQGDVLQVPKEFIGRQRELAQIREYILERQNQKYVLVLLHGLPMTGKSTLARQLVDSFASMWSDGHFMADLKGISSHYIHNTEAKVSVIRTLYPILALPSSKAEVNGIFQSCFAGKRSILLLENVGRVDQIKDLILPASANAKSLLVIVTSRRDLPIEVELEGISIKLSALDEVSSIKLLRSVMGGRGPQFNDAMAAQLVKLCGYMPLPIRMLAANAARLPDVSSIESLLQTVQADDSKRIELLFGKLSSFFDFHTSPSSESLKDIAESHEISHSSGSVPEAKPYDSEPSRPPQEFVLSLSVFPSTFDLLAVSYLWGTSAKETGSILQNLVDSNEVDLSQDKLRYTQNDLFRSWATKKALEVFGENGILQWKSVFVNYFLSVMRKCTDFYSKHQVKQGLEILSLEAANFEAAITYSLQINDLRVCASILNALNKFNAFFGSGEQRKWDKLKIPLNSNAEIVKLAEEFRLNEKASPPASEAETPIPSESTSPVPSIQTTAASPPPIVESKPAEPPKQTFSYVEAASHAGAKDAKPSPTK